MPAALDALVIGLYVQIDDFLGPRHRGVGRPPKLTDAELITLAVAQVLLGMPNDRQFLALARWRLGHLFPRLIDQSGYNRRLRALAPEIGRAITYLAFISPSFCDRLRLLDSTPVPCGQSRETTRRSEFAGYAGYGYCRSHSRWFWGFRLYLICSADGMPIGWELAAANIGERVVAAEMLDRVSVAGHTVIADKNFSGAEFEQLMADHGATFLRPDRKNEPRRHGSLGAVRQWIESTFWTCKGQLGLERHGARTLTGLGARIGLRLLALAAAIWHNHLTGQPPRNLAAYGR
ncbi:IS982 family transposase [Kribbella sp.]|uniref:IS982 family transposase n=1 Tax=Kribbella sp. TaxID=1871183 RepID=UPI002D3FBBE6|nr:IS982 family transposase [Kribbella sp.]HZX07081.1 IS982 family transposase [Kribbella sp.]